MLNETVLVEEGGKGYLSPTQWHSQPVLCGDWAGLGDSPGNGFIK